MPIRFAPKTSPTQQQEGHPSLPEGLARATFQAASLQPPDGITPRRTAADGGDPGSPPKRGFADLSPDLLRKLYSHVKQGTPRDEASLASVNRDTFNALDEHRQLQLMGRGQQARTLEALMKVVQETLTLATGLRAELLGAAGHQLGRLAHSAQGPNPGAPIFYALWNAVIELPDKQRPKPLFAVARQVAVLPPQERLAAMNTALDHISLIPRDNQRFGSYETTRFQTVRDYAYLLPKLPAQDRSPALQRLSIEGKAFSEVQQHEFFGLLEKTNSLTPATAWHSPFAGQAKPAARAAWPMKLPEAPPPRLE
jgi:hypothetical protein